MSDQDTTQNRRPADELTNGFNALYVEASLTLEGSCDKVSFMNYLARNREEMTHFNTDPDSKDNIFSKHQPHCIQHLTSKDFMGDLWPTLDFSTIIPLAENLLNLHRSQCDCETAFGLDYGFIVRGKCMKCDKTQPRDCCDRHAMNPDDEGECAAWVGSNANGDLFEVVE